MRELRDALLVIFGMCFLIFALVGLQPQNAIKGAHAQSTALGPNGTVVALSTTSGQIIGTNPSRHALQFCNSTGIVEYIAPAPLVPLTGGTIGIGLPAIASGVTSCFSPPVNAPSIGQAWNGVSASATPNITVMEYP